MANLMNPSIDEKPITEGQIGKICELLSSRIRLRKDDKVKIPSELVQYVLHRKGPILVNKMTDYLVEMIKELNTEIIRKVKVNREQSPGDALRARARTLYNWNGNSFITEMPKGKGQNALVFFFKLNRRIDDEALEEEYKIRGLVPADPYSLAAVNADDADWNFSKKYRNVTHWKNNKSEWCSIIFSQQYVSEDRADTNRGNRTYSENIWFAGM